MTLQTELLAIAEFTVMHLCSPKDHWSLWYKITENVINNVLNSKNIEMFWQISR